jgi:hypothetical protein
VSYLHCSYVEPIILRWKYAEKIRSIQKQGEGADPFCIAAKKRSIERRARNLDEAGGSAIKS